MANVYAVATGNWSAPATWNTGFLPTSSDDVYANGFTVTIDQNVTVLSLRTQSGTGIAAGGSFALQAGKTVNANVFAGSTGCINFSATGTSTINGNSTGATSHGILINGTSAVLNVNGNCTGGTASTASGVFIAGTNCVLNLTGDATGGSVSGTQAGVYVNSASATVNITGNVYGSSTSYGVYIPAASQNITINGNVAGGTGGSCFGMYVNVANVVATINGTVTGGQAASAFGVYNNAISTVIINGTAMGGMTAQGAVNNSTGTLRVTIAKGSETASFQGLYGVNVNGTTTWEKAEFSSIGSSPLLGCTKMHPASVNTIKVWTDSGIAKTIVVTSQVTNGQPAVEDVRAGTAFDFGNKTGTCAVPVASQVAAGIAVDDTTGTALLTAAAVKAAVLDADVSTLTASNSIGERLKNCATVQTTGDQVAILNP